MEERAFYLGCPIWAHAGWPGRFYRSDAKRSDYLSQYASVFNAVEGNSTFYGLPSPESVARWAVEAPAGFRFCFKFPRTVTHELRLEDAEAETAEFFERLAPLGGRLGPMLVQLPSSFGPAHMGALDSFLSDLPPTFRYAVEVRHRAFFAEGDEEAALDALLRARGVDRVLFDTTGLFSAGAPLPESLAEVLVKKPRVPKRRTVTAKSPVVRFIGDPDLMRSRGPLRAWASELNGWIDSGLTPFFFAHHADDTFAPDVARILHEELIAIRPGVARPAAWPVERERAGVDRDDPGGQMVLFS
ncbi:MAG TPA: DUF72 domain-containing protein [Opitutaceae bacterium]|nr:DUF72 domain-containing protein [Opitutaceae bacterium]